MSMRSSFLQAHPSFTTSPSNGECPMDRAVKDVYSSCIPGTRSSHGEVPWSRSEPDALASLLLPTAAITWNCSLYTIVVCYNNITPPPFLLKT